MKKIYPHILLLFFSAFLLCSAMSSAYPIHCPVQDSGTEDFGSLPEGPQEDAPVMEEKEFFSISGASVPVNHELNPEGDLRHLFSLVENIYFEVPHSPPN